MADAAAPGEAVDFARARVAHDLGREWIPGARLAPVSAEGEDVGRAPQRGGPSEERAAQPVLGLDLQPLVRRYPAGSSVPAQRDLALQGFRGGGHRGVLGSGLVRFHRGSGV